MFYYFQFKAVHFLDSLHNLTVNSSSEEVVLPVGVLLGLSCWDIPVEWFCVCARDFRGTFQFYINFSAWGVLYLIENNNVGSTTTAGTAPGF